MIRPHQACHNSAPPRVLRAPSGYIASTVSDMTGCGLADAPWVIEVRPGQKINITLFDFSQRHTAGKHGDLGPSGYTGQHGKMYIDKSQDTFDQDISLCTD